MYLRGKKIANVLQHKHCCQFCPLNYGAQYNCMSMYNNKNLICEGMLVKLDSDSDGLWQKGVNAP